MPYKDAPGATGPTGGRPIPDPPTTPPPEGYRYELQTDPQTGEKWWQLAVAAVGAIGSYLSARQANKPRTNETDQTTTQTPYLADLYRPDIEAILNYQRDLINQGPHYVGNQRFWPTSSSPQPGRAPAPMERSDQRLARNVAALDEWRAAGGYRAPGDAGGGGGGGIGRGAGAGSDPEFGAGAPANSPDPPATIPMDKAGLGAPGTRGSVPQSRLYGGWTAEELSQDPERISRLGEHGARKYARYQDRMDEDQGLTLARLRAIFGRT
jgi:hypothetical protein